MSLGLYLFLLRTVLIGLPAMVLLLVLRRRSASVQHSVSASALIATLVLVPASFIVKKGMKPICTTSFPFVEASTVEVSHGSPQMWSVAPNAPNKRELDSVPKPLIERTGSTGVAEGVFWIDPIELWASIAGILLVRFIAGLALLGRRLSLSKRVDVRPNLTTVIDPHTRVPTAVWWGRPIIVLPPSWESWSEQRLDTVLMHESVHLDRGDCWIQFAGAIACALAWPNPLIWWLKARTRALSEESVDDFVLRVGVPPFRYAQDLLDVAQCSRSQFNGLGLQMAAKPEVFRRIEMILNDQKQRGAVSMAALIAMGVGFSSLAVVASGWSLVPAGTIAKVEKMLPNPIRQAFHEVGTLGAAFRNSASTAVSPKALRSANLSGLSWDSPAPPVEPAVPSSLFGKSVAKAADKIPTGATPTGQVYRVKIQTYSLDPATDMAQFGIDASSPTPAGGTLLSQSQLTDLRSRLEAAGKRCVNRQSVEAMAETPGNERFLGSTSEGGESQRKDRVVVQTNGDKAAKVIVVIESDSAANLPQAMVTVPVAQDHPGAYVLPRKHLRGWYDLWLIQAYPKPHGLTLATFLTKLSTDSPESPSAKSLRIWYSIRRVTLSAKQFAAKLHALPEGDEVYRVTDFSENSSLCQVLLHGNRSWLDFGMPDAVLGKPTVQEVDDKDRESVSACFSQNGVLRFEINPDLPLENVWVSKNLKGDTTRGRFIYNDVASDSSWILRPLGSDGNSFTKLPKSPLPHFVSEQKLKPGDERLVVGRPDPKTGTIPAWIIGLQFYDDGFWLSE